MQVRSAREPAGFTCFHSSCNSSRVSINSRRKWRWHSYWTRHGRSVDKVEEKKVPPGGTQMRGEKTESHKEGKYEQKDTPALWSPASRVGVFTIVNITLFLKWRYNKHEDSIGLSTFLVSNLQRDHTPTLHSHFDLRVASRECDS